MKGWSRYRRIRASRVRTRYRENSTFVIAEILKRFSKYDLMRPLRPASEAEGRRPVSLYRYRLGLPVSADLRIDSTCIYRRRISLSLHPVTRSSIQLFRSPPSSLRIRSSSSFLTPVFITLPLCICRHVLRHLYHLLRDLCWHLAFTGYKPGFCFRIRVSPSP